MKITKIEELKIGDWVLVQELLNSPYIILQIDKNELVVTCPVYLAWDTITLTFDYYDITLIGKTRPKFKLMYRLFGRVGGVICPFKMIPFNENVYIEQEFLKQIS